MRSTMGALGAAAILAVAVLAASAAHAQSNVQCREAGADAERIACLEARIDALEEALSRVEAGSAAAETAASVPGPAPGPAPAPAPVDPADAFGGEQLDPAPVAAAAATTPATTAAPRAGRRWLRMPNIPFIGGDDDEDDEDAEAAPTAVAAAPAATPAPVDPEGFGAEQVAARTQTRDNNPRDAEDDILRAKIVGFEELHRGRLVIALDNGQIWRQLDVDSRTVRLQSEVSYDVEIWRSGFGGYRMKVADNARIMSVERLR